MFRRLLRKCYEAVVDGSRADELRSDPRTHKARL